MRKPATPQSKPQTWEEHIASLSKDEVIAKAEEMASYAVSCREIGQGINSKEVIAFKMSMKRIESERLLPPHSIIDLYRQWNPGLIRNEFHRQMLTRLFENGGTLEGMAALFAPV